MSMVTELSKPAARATKLAPITPAAGPDSAMLIGLPVRLPRAEHAAVRLHHQERRGDAALREAGLQPADVGADEPLHVGVERRRHRALVFAEHRQHVGGDRDRGRREIPRATISAARRSCGGIGIGMQKDDRHRLDAERAQPPRGRPARRPRRAAARPVPSSSTRSGTSMISRGGTGRFGLRHTNRFSLRGISCRPISST